MTKCTNDLKTEFCIQTIKLYLCPGNDDWDYEYDAVSKAKRYLKAERHLTRAQEILLGSSTCRTNQPLGTPLVFARLMLQCLDADPSNRSTASQLYECLGIAADTAEALETIVDIQLVQKLQTKVVSLHPETGSQTQL